MSLKQLVNDKKILDAFKEFLEEKIELEQRQLESAVGLESVYRNQGAIRAYRRLLKIREEVNGPEKAY